MIRNVRMDTKLLPPYVLTHFDSWAFCVIAFEPIELQTCSVPQNDRLDLSFVKDQHTAGKKWPDMVVKWPFVNYYLLKVSQACARPPFISEAIHFKPIKIQTHQAPKNDRLNLSFVKDKHTVGEKMARNSSKIAILLLLFVFTQTIILNNH